MSVVETSAVVVSENQAKLDAEAAETAGAKMVEADTKIETKIEPELVTVVADLKTNDQAKTEKQVILDTDVDKAEAETIAIVAFEEAAKAKEEAPELPRVSQSLPELPKASQTSPKLPRSSQNFPRISPERSQNEPRTSPE